MKNKFGKTILKYFLSFSGDIVIYILNALLKLGAVFLNVSASTTLKKGINELDERISIKIERL